MISASLDCISQKEWKEYSYKNKTGGTFRSTFKIQDMYLRLSPLTLITNKVIMNIRVVFFREEKRKIITIKFSKGARRKEF